MDGVRTDMRRFADGLEPAHYVIDFDSRATWSGTRAGGVRLFCGGKLKMMVLITYDVTNKTAEARKRLRYGVRTCENPGQRVQNFVFGCLVDPALRVESGSKQVNMIEREPDRLVFYLLGKN